MLKLIVTYLLILLSVNANVLVKHVARYPFPSSTPTCLESASRPDVALVYYPTIPGHTCDDRGGQISADSIWFGFHYGACHENDLCGISDCTCLAECASKGYTTDQYNDCYATTCNVTCPPVTTYVTVVPDGTGQVVTTLYSDPSCTVLKAGNTTSDYHRLNKCDGDWFGCDYGSTTWSETACETDSASGLEMFFDF